VARSDSGARTVTISRLATEPGGPGRAFKLTEGALLELLEVAARDYVEIELTSAGGVPQLVFGDDPAIAGSELLRHHYRNLVGHADVRGSALICGPSGRTPDNQAFQPAIMGLRG
jgi:hypothetical protein